MPNVFINYRSGDTGDVAALVERDLSGRFGTEVFFRASKSIRPGDDYTQALLQAVRMSDALLAFIGPHWLDADDNGRRKIDQEDDWTRQELAEAFRYGVRVIPILVGTARPLQEKDLPNDLARLALCQYIRLDHRNPDADLNLLAGRLTQLVPGLRNRPEGDGGTRTPKPDRPGGPGGVNNAGRDMHIGVQAETVYGVRIDGFGPSGRPATPDGEGAQ